MADSGLSAEGVDRLRQKLLNDPNLSLTPEERELLGAFLDAASASAASGHLTSLTKIEFKNIPVGS